MPRFCHFLYATSLIVLTASGLRAVPPRAIVVPPASGPTRVSRALEGTLARSGYRVESRGFEALVRPNALDGVSLLALADSGTLPHEMHGPIERFVHRGGDMIVFGLPAWKTPLLRTGDKWVGAQEYANREAFTPPPHTILDLGAADIAAWTRSTNNPGSNSAAEIVKANAGPALHVTIPDLTSWDTLASPPMENPFPAGMDRFVFSARGGPRTKNLAVEWEEKDGSRWIATVPLSVKWRRYELAPESFKYWASTAGRGGGGDRFHPENASRLSVGLAFSHTGQIGGAHEFWFARPGAAWAQDAPLSTLDTREWLDGIYPAFKTFRIRDRVTLKPSGGPLFPAVDLPDAGGVLRSPHPRPTGAGYLKGRERRFVTLLEARSKNGAWRGTPGALYIHTSGRYKGSHWAIFGISDQGFLASSPFQKALGVLARRFQGPMLAEGGADWYTYLPGASARLGAAVTGPVSAKTLVDVSVLDADSGREQASFQWKASALKTESLPAPAPGEAWRVMVTLREGSTVVDRLVHDVHTWTPTARPEFVTARDGRFYRAGKPWKIHGVNYMPSSGVGRDHPEDQQHFEMWLDPAPYDTVIVGRDLDTVKRLGLNSVSIFCYGGSVESGNLLDILRLCRDRGLLVNLSLRPGTPMDFQWDQIRPVIERYRLAENDTVFAYDLAWEPSWGGQRDRARYDSLWEEWVVKRYGDLEKAEAAWAYSAPRAGGRLTNPTDEQVTRDGPWRRMSVDYRDFLGDLLRERYGKARDMVRGVDPNHLVSFRMSEAGNPTFDYPAFLPYDFRKLAEAVDFLAPEAYGRIGTWDNARHGWFEVAFARAVAPDLPVIWAEVGVSAWEAGTDEAAPERLSFQAEYFRAFYRMMRASGSNGIYFWWYPGGFRSNEVSDYGIINPDGTDRPSSVAIRENGPAFLASPAPVPVDIRLDVYPDRYANGIVGAYQAVRDEWWRLVEQGKSPGLVLR